MKIGALFVIANQFQQLLQGGAELLQIGADLLQIGVK